MSIRVNFLLVIAIIAAAMAAPMRELSASDDVQARWHDQVFPQWIFGWFFNLISTLPTWLQVFLRMICCH